MPETRGTTDLFLGIDMGTSACRAVAVDDAGAVAATASAPLPPPRRDGPRVEQDPRVWRDAMAAAIAALGRRIPLSRIAAVAVDGTSGTLLITDAHGVPLTPALMYNDARSTAEAARIDTVAATAAAVHGPTSALAKAMHLCRHYSPPRDSRAVHQADWLAAGLSGRGGVSDENNALKLGYDPVTRRWPEWTAALGVGAHLLPEVVPPGTPLGTVTATAAAALGLRRETRVIAGTTDGVAAFIASGAADAGEAVTSLGSTLVLKVLSPSPVFAPAFGVYSHRLGERWLVGGASNSGGAVLRLYFSDAELERFSRAIDPLRPSGLDYYPLPAVGERFPVNDPAMAPRLDPRPEDPTRFLHGLLEGIARIERDGYRCLARLGAPYPTGVRSVGGGTRNRVWAGIRQEMLGVPLVQARSEEAAYGTALLSLQGFKMIN
jgi:sugar (pentulose or hexulose) kinase